MKIITVPPPIPTSAEPRTTRQRSSRESNDSANEDIDSAQPDNLKRRRLDLGDLMVKPAAPEKLISAKHVDLFRQAKRPEITRLTDSYPIPPPPLKWSLRRGTGKAGQPTVTDQIKAREAVADLRASEAALRKSVNGSRISVEMKPYEQCKLWRIRT